MSVKVSSWVWHDEATSTINGNEMILLLALADVADDNGRCRFLMEEDALTYDGLARKVRVDRRTIERLIPRLRERGLVAHVRGSKTRPNEFVILVPWAKSSTDKMSGNVSDSPTTLTGFPDNGDSRTSLKRIDVIQHQIDAASRELDAVASSREEAFGEFWSVYPRKVGKAVARSKFMAAVKRTDPSVVVEGARRFAADPNLPEKQFIPHPATWLSQGRWEDEPLPERSWRPDPDFRPSGEVYAHLTEGQMVALPAWLSVLKIGPEEFLERRGEPGWVEAMEARAREAS